MADEASQGGRPDPSMPGFTTMFWHRLMAMSMAAANLSEWAVLAELALVMVPGSVEAERMFSTLSFLKNKLRLPAGIGIRISAPDFGSTTLTLTVAVRLP